MRKTPADREQGLIGGMSGDQVIGLPSSTLQCGESLEEGFRLLEEYRGEQETVQRILMNLSQGFEHLLKLTLWLIGEEFPRNHDIPELLDAILPKVPEEWMPPGRHRLLKEDCRFRGLMAILGKYGGSGKYSFLDAATGASTKTTLDDSPTDMWKEMERDLLDDDGYEELQRNPRWLVERYYPHLYEVVATSLARGIHSLWWIWVNGPTAERGRKWHSGLTHAARHRVNRLVQGY